MDETPDEPDGMGTAVVGSAGIALLMLVALLIGAVPYTVALVGVAHLPSPGGVRGLEGLDLLVRAGLAFLIFALAEVPAGVAGKTVTIWMGLRNHHRQRADSSRARAAGQVTAQLLKGTLLVLVLSAWVTTTVTGAILVALLTVLLEVLLEPLVDRYVKR